MLKQNLTATKSQIGYLVQQRAVASDSELSENWEARTIQLGQFKIDKKFPSTSDVEKEIRSLASIYKGKAKHVAFWAFLSGICSQKKDFQDDNLKFRTPIC